MAITLTPTRELQKPAPDDPNWDVPLLANMEALDAWLGKQLSKSVAGGVDVALTKSEAAAASIIFTGALTANISVTLPFVGSWVVENATTGAFTLTVKNVDFASDAGVAVQQGQRATILLQSGKDTIELSATLDSSGKVPTAQLPDRAIADITNLQASLNAKANSATTLAGYGITDAATINTPVFTGQGKLTGGSFTDTTILAGVQYFPNWLVETTSGRSGVVISNQNDFLDGSHAAFAFVNPFNSSNEDSFNVLVSRTGTTPTDKFFIKASGRADFSALSVAGSTVWTAANLNVNVALTDGATIALDLSLSNQFSVTLAGNRTLANPTNAVAGLSGTIIVQQDATGSRTLSYGANYKWPGGVAPTLSTGANAVDVISYLVKSSTEILCTFNAAFS